MNRRLTATGFAMLEVLVTLVILLVGLLGLAGVMARSSTAEMESYQRVQAVVLAQDMVDRINANRYYANCYSNAGVGMTVGTGYSATPTCTSGTSAGAQARAVTDLQEWDGLLKGAAEVSGGSKFGAMIDARGCVVRTDATKCIYTVSVAWQGLVPTVTPADTCGQNQYGTDSRRRVVTMQVRIAQLSTASPC